MTTATELICDECEQPLNSPVHAKVNWASEGGEGHPFTERSRSAAPIRKMTPAEKAADPGPIGSGNGKPKPLCTICKKPGIAHRGKKDHIFSPPGGFVSRAKSVAGVTAAAAGAAPKRRGRPPGKKRSPASRPRRQKVARAPRTDIVEKKINRVMDLAARKRELEAELHDVVTELQKLIA